MYIICRFYTFVWSYNVFLCSLVLYIVYFKLTTHFNNKTLNIRLIFVLIHFFSGSEVAMQAVSYAKDAIKSYKRAPSFSPGAPPEPKYDCPPPYQVTPSRFPFSSPQPSNTQTYSPYQPMYSHPNRSASSVEGAVGWPPR